MKKITYLKNKRGVCSRVLDLKSSEGAPSTLLNSKTENWINRLVFIATVCGNDMQSIHYFRLFTFIATPLKMLYYQVLPLNEARLLDELTQVLTQQSTDYKSVHTFIMIAIFDSNLPSEIIFASF